MKAKKGSTRDEPTAVGQAPAKEPGPAALAQAILARFHPKGPLKLRFTE